MTDAEFETMCASLRRFCEEELDQWERWRTLGRHGWVYIVISRMPPEGQHGHYDDMMAHQAKEDPDASSGHRS